MKKLEKALRNALQGKMSDEDFRKLGGKWAELKNVRKLKKYLAALVHDPAFIKAVREIRAKHKISDDLTEMEGQIVLDGLEENVDFVGDCLRALNFFGLLDMRYVPAFARHVVFGRTLIQPDFLMSTLIQVVDVRSEYDDMEKQTNKVVKELARELENIRRITYPISIHFSPYVSERDLLNFISKVYTSSIEPLQAKYRKDHVKIGKYGARSVAVRERNNFIFEHKHHPARKIMQLLAQRYGWEQVLDQSYIAKIIRDEERRRKEV